MICEQAHHNIYIFLGFHKKICEEAHHNNFFLGFHKKIVCQATQIFLE
jgi:hypothetical protein